MPEPSIFFGESDLKDLNGWDSFIQNCQQMESPEQLINFFELTLTPAEREKIAARYLILSELIHGKKTHREIAAELQVSIFNVTRGANQLKKTDSKTQQLIHAAVYPIPL